MQAKVSEIFLSFQGEGPYAGSSQLFVRFYGCNLKCAFCDTPLESYKSFTKESLFGNVLDMGDGYNEIALTGGEPLLHADFLAGFLELFKGYKKQKVYLETNGTLPGELQKVINLVDIVAMDFKLPGSTGLETGDIWPLHKRFADVARDKELIIKAVVTSATGMEDIKKMSEILKGVKGEANVILQPVSPENNNVKEPDGEMLVYFRKFLEKETRRSITVLGQMHKMLGIR